MRLTEEEYQEVLNRSGIKKPKKSKYNNKKTVIDGITFDSRKEANYYCQLKILESAREIRGFTLQPKFVLQEGFNKNGKRHRPINYYADFLIENLDGTKEVVDVKGFETNIFKIKKKMFEYKYPDLSLKIVK